MTLFSCCIVAGFFLDGWSHLHQRTARSLLSPWHALLYLSAVATTLYLLLPLLLQRLRGRSERLALPDGYGLSAVGALLFFVGASGDLLWYLQFGFEVDVETLLSPPHLLLGLSALRLGG